MSGRSITADDAGGMHPQLQRPHGVKLVVLNRAAPYAREVLEDAGLLPHHFDERQPVAEGDPDEEHESRNGGLTFSTERSGVITISIIILIIAGLIILGLSVFPPA